MLTRQEYNDLYRLIDDLCEAYEAYVYAMVNTEPNRFGLGAVVAEIKEAVQKKLKELS